MLEVCRLVLRSGLSFLYSFLFGREGGAGVDSALSKGGGFGGLSGIEWRGVFFGIGVIEL